MAEPTRPDDEDLDLLEESVDDIEPGREAEDVRGGAKNQHYLK